MSRPSGKTEACLRATHRQAFSRVVIDAQLKDVGWNLKDGQSVRYEYQLPDGTFADYVLNDRHGRAMAVVEAKRAAVNLQEAAHRAGPMPSSWTLLLTDIVFDITGRTVKRARHAERKKEKYKDEQ